MIQNKTLSFMLLTVSVTSFAPVTNAQESAPIAEMGTLVVTATRQGMAANELAHAVTVIDRQTGWQRIVVEQTSDGERGAVRPRAWQSWSWRR